jgi:hypothetical protein
MISASLQHLFENVFFVVGNIWHAFWQLVWGMFDQTHYHIAALKLHIGISFHIVTHYFKSIPRHFIVHYCHQCYLRDIGFAGESDLVDVGTIFWHKSPTTSSSPSINKAVSISDNSSPRNHPKSPPTVTGMKGNKSGNPAHVSLASLSLQKLWCYLNHMNGLNLSTTIFIDFGSGTGLAVLSALTQPFQKVIGVEMDPRSNEMAKRNLDRFVCSKIATSLIICNNVSLRCSNMLDFDFTSLPTSSDSSLTKPFTAVLYMYEPLWTLSRADAHKTYMEILTRARDSGLNVLVAYFDCGLFSGNALTALTELGARQIHKSPADSLEFGTDGHMWIYRL